MRGVEPVSDLDERDPHFLKLATQNEGKTAIKGLSNTGKKGGVSSAGARTRSSARALVKPDGFMFKVRAFRRAQPIGRNNQCYCT